MVGAVVAAGTVGAAIPLAGPFRVAIGLGAAVVVAAVALHPPLGAYALIGITPLVAGIDRDTVLPVLRPNEALAMLVGFGLLVRAAVRFPSGGLPHIRVGPVDRSIVLLAAAASILPLAWMLVRGQDIVADDLLYALMIWKYYGVYLIVRASIRTVREVKVCLGIALVSATIVSVLAVLDSLHVLGVTRLLAPYYTPYGNAAALHDNRGGATLSLPVAVADLLTFNLAVVIGLLVRHSFHRGLLWFCGGLFVLGALSSGEFSALIALVVGTLTAAVVTRRVRPVVALVPAVA
ncbi:MAG: hypothetical protein ABR518_01760, partial [Actinomycetota bacterium]